MTRLFCMVTISSLLFFTGGSSVSRAVPVVNDPVSGVSNSDPICHLPIAISTPVKLATSAITAGLTQEQEGSTHCERPSKDNPDVGGKDKNKLGCMCIYKCVNGKPEEDNSNPEARCKNFCKKEQCECTKPSCES